VENILDFSLIYSLGDGNSRFGFGIPNNMSFVEDDSIPDDGKQGSVDFVLGHHCLVVGYN